MIQKSQFLKFHKIHCFNLRFLVYKIFLTAYQIFNVKFLILVDENPLIIIICDKYILLNSTVQKENRNLKIN
jgi:hypothetical protein